MLSSAIILAGGFGTRLKSVVTDLPKPMADVCGRPFLDYQLDYLKYQGITHVCLSVGHLANKIITHYGFEYNGLQLSYAQETEPLGTGGGIRLALEQVNEQEVLVLNGDSFFELDIKAFYNQHLFEKAQISLALRNVDNASRYGAIGFDESKRIIAFKEKSSSISPGYINAGVYLINKNDFLKVCPNEKNFSIEKDVFEKQLGTLKIMGFVFNDYFIDIGIPEDYIKAQHDFKGFKYK